MNIPPPFVTDSLCQTAEERENGFSVTNHLESRINEPIPEASKLL